MSKWIAEFELEDGDTMPEHMDLEYKGAKIDFHCRSMWILCSERLPEDDTEVLVYLFENNKSPYIAWLSDARWYTEYFEVERENEPVAWMPLPEPYKGDE